MAAMMALWLLRHPLNDFVEHRLLGRLRGGMRTRLSRLIHFLGVFCRVWCLLLVCMFAKLMVVDFGWAELPHLYFIGIFLVLLFSNHLTNELTWIETRTAQTAQDGKQGQGVLIALGSAVLFATLMVYSGLYVLTKISHPLFL